ncbi:MAG: TIGR01458 family HAD-type hydrolase [Granulosicoccaceae bacterium]|jgi:HAD superfamily hydrolase (TIGR01458 family)
MYLRRESRYICRMDLNAHALFLDLSGVIYEGSRPLPGASEAVEKARRRGLVLRFVTNTATSSSEAILDKLAGMGVPIEPDELFTAPIAAKHYIQHHDLRPFCLVHEAIQPEFADLDHSEPNCVLLGDAREGLNYAALNRAFRLCKQGATLIGIGMNKYFKDESGLNLDAGPFIRAIEWAADTPAIIMGKPSQAFFDQIIASTPFTAGQCLMVGDDLEGDVQGAVAAGLQACLVKTGKYQAGDEQRLPAGAMLAGSLADLFA